MDFSKINKNKILIGILILVIISLLLYNKPLFSDKPLGLDSLGHLSKVSYLKEFGNVNWDMSWYSGGPFLRFYPPLYYYTLSLFDNVFFGSNLICFLSILFCSIGVFLLVNHYSKNFLNSLLAGMFFLAVINISYFWIVVGNQPFIFALWTIPFSLLLFEKSREKKVYYILYLIVFLIGILSHIFVGLCICLIIIIRVLFYKGLKEKSLNVLFFLIIPIGISCFWLVPFLTRPSSFVGDEIYILSPLSLFGIKLSHAWGIGFDSIGIFLIIFLASLFYFRRNYKDKTYLYLFIMVVLLFLLSAGILGKYYPRGIGSVRFIPAFSIFLCIFIGVSLKNLKNKMYYIIIILILVYSLFTNYQVINENYTYHSYSNKDMVKYGKFANVYDEFYNFSFINKSYSNYRFGSARFPFSKTLTFVFPGISQTSGYYDEGLLYFNTYFKMKENIWIPINMNKTYYYLDWFGIKYFELSGGYLEGEGNFSNNTNFQLVLIRNSSDYPYKIYEYKKAKPIISVIKTNFLSYDKLNEDEIDEIATYNKNTEELIPIITEKKIAIYNNYSEMNFTYIRNNPDIINIEYDFTGNEAILIRESYYPSWKAKEQDSLKNLKVYRTANDFMLIIPKAGDKKIVIYQTKLFVDYFGIIVSLICIIIAICYLFSFKNEFRLVKKE